MHEKKLVAGQKTVYEALYEHSKLLTRYITHKSSSCWHWQGEIVNWLQNNEGENRCTQLPLHSEKSLIVWSNLQKDGSNSQQDCINFPQVKGREFYYSQHDSSQTPGKSSHTCMEEGKKTARDRERECKIQEQALKRSRVFRGGKQMDQSSIYTHTQRITNSLGLQRSTHASKNTRHRIMPELSATSIIVF